MQKIIKRSHNTLAHGFTLIELMILLAVVSIGVVGLGLIGAVIYFMISHAG